MGRRSRAVVIVLGCRRTPYLARNNGGATPRRESVQSLSLGQAVISFLQRDATPTLFLVVSGLPKGALIEKQVLYHTGRGSSVADDGNEGDTATPVSFPASYGTGTSWYPIKRRSYLNWLRHRSVLRRRY